MGTVVTLGDFRAARDVASVDASGFDMSSALPTSSPERSFGKRLLSSQHWPPAGVVAGDAVVFAAIGCACWLLWHDGASSMNAVSPGVGWRSPAISDSAPGEWRSPSPLPLVPSADTGS